MKPVSSNSFKHIVFFLFTVVGLTSSQNVKCPFIFLYQFGDGITDIGNAVRILPVGPFVPATRYPYGETYPGRPTGRWSDGLIDVDFTAQGVGLPSIKQYINLDFSTTYDGVVFSVEGATVLNNSFFISNRISVPPYNTPLSTQLTWFRIFLKSICTNQKDCSNRQPPNAVTFFAFPEANDIGYALVQGKSIEEVRSYLPLIIQAKINAAREIIQLGATRFIYSTAAPLGCYPYILTALFTNDPTAYDAVGCLIAVNNLIISMNNDLQAAFNGLRTEFPTVTILAADFYNASRTVINQASVIGPGGNPALRSCCGIGGRYNYDSQRFCGSLNVPVCPNPNNYVYWDGLHFTQEAYRRIVNMLIPKALPQLNCTTT